MDRGLGSTSAMSSAGSSTSRPHVPLHVRGQAAIAQSKELAALKQERDSLQSSLEQAERRELVANRQIRSERDRRATLTPCGAGSATAFGCSACPR